MKTQYVVKFMQYYTSGTRKGLTFNCQMIFPTLEAATAHIVWCAAHTNEPVRAAGDYTIHLPRLEAKEPK